MLPLDLEHIQKHLSSQSIHSKVEPETNQICMMLKIAEREFPLFIRVYEGGEILQLLSFLPCNIKPSALADSARLLHLLNKEIDLPGFGMDEDNKVVFYRSMIPAKDKKINKDIFNALLNATQVVCTSFAPVIAAVAFGTVSFEDVVLQAKQHNQSVAQSQLKSEG